MKNFLLLALLITVALSFSANAKTIEIEVHGMTCALCVDTLNRKFNKMAGISKVKVNIKMKTLRLETASTSPAIAMIKQAILDAGFMPIKVTIISDKEAKETLTQG
ncbi:heavy-metal-associated domain-containing protein [Colwellia psychrerythraea]|uniref:Heavy metal transport/detoxification protein n=1 Tax=Colwellia psychrerythraea TaxID=28229 RepID=A0A099KP51_COLPS|nr:cation transporter [Colwellia psychrerythraea]KGJ91672.1 Heavy metal transport/detoxification protein [Colwellia psychrerythraea]